MKKHFFLSLVFAYYSLYAMDSSSIPLDPGNILDPFQTEKEDSYSYTIGIGYLFGELLPTNQVIATAIGKERVAVPEKMSPVLYEVALAQGINIDFSLDTPDHHTLFLTYDYFGNQPSSTQEATATNETALVSTWPIKDLVSGATDSVSSVSGSYDIAYNHEVKCGYFREIFRSLDNTTSIFIHYAAGALFRYLKLTTTYQIDHEDIFETYRYKQIENRQTAFLSINLETISKITNHVRLYAGVRGNGHIGSFTVVAKESFSTTSIATPTSSLNSSYTQTRLFEELQAYLGFSFQVENSSQAIFGLDGNSLFGVEPGATTLGIPQTAGTAPIMSTLFRIFGTLSLYTKF